MAVIARSALSSPGPGILLVRLSDGVFVGHAAGPARPQLVRQALAALRGRDALAIAMDPEALGAAAALVALAALDLAARRAQVPAVLLLGGRPAEPIPLALPPEPMPLGTRALPGDVARLRQMLADPGTLRIVADPVAAGGLAGLERLAAAARAFAVEIALAPVPFPAAIAAAAHLRAALPWLARQPLLAAGEWQPDPTRPGFGWEPPEPER